MVLSSETASANSPSVVPDPLHEVFTQLRDHSSRRVLLSARVQMHTCTCRRIIGAGHLLKWRYNYYRQLALSAWRGNHFQLIVHHRLIKDLNAAWSSDTRRSSISEVLTPDNPFLGEISHLVSINQINLRAQKCGNRTSGCKIRNGPFRHIWEDNDQELRVAPQNMPNKLEFD